MEKYIAKYSQTNTKKGKNKMNNGKLVLKKCLKCGKIIEEIESTACDTMCCGEPMQLVASNSTDGAAEKHVPTYEVLEGKIEVSVNHVMDEDHYIEWIKLVYEDSEKTVYFKPGDEPKAHCKYEPGMKIYAYCNKHGLWVRDVV